MKLHNTLSRKLEEVVGPDDGRLGIYSCGPTAYDHVTIGNLSSFIYADTLRRALIANGFNVKHVMNITDIDDKTVKRSRQEYPDQEPKKALKQLTDKYSDIFYRDMAAIGNDVKALTFTNATDHIPAMQALIKKLFDDGFAYVADDGVYFSIEAYRKSGKKYGQLTNITEDSTSASRIQNDEYDKASPHDFALWKLQAADEPAWQFELAGKQLGGRPGWHIECSAMSRASLGQPFDIHTGGVDLIFPHHENEIAQSTAGESDPHLARYFIHNEHLLVDGQKMAKSLNNFYTIEDVTKKGFDPLAFRLLILQSHYRNQAHFSWENLQAAQNRLQDFRALAALRWQPRDITHDAGTFTLEDAPVQLATIVAEDLRTPQALNLLSEISTQLQTVLIERDMLDHFQRMLQGIDQLFGLQLYEVPDISPHHKQLIKQREEARQAEDWAGSDKIREELKNHGIGLRDTNEGTIWFPL